MLGEEEGGDDASGWIIDPIDGTRNYTRGIPIWATLIAFADRVAVVSAPALGRRWWAVRGGGAFANGVPIHVSGIDRIEDATLLYALDRPVARARLRRLAPTRLRRLLGAHARGRGRGRGRRRRAGLAIWDTAAVAVIVEEAGGRFTEHVSSNGALRPQRAALTAAS